MSDFARKKVLEIIAAEGGTIPRDYFAILLRDMVDREQVRVVFPDNKMFDSKYEYHLPKEEGSR